MEHAGDVGMNIQQRETKAKAKDMYFLMYLGSSHFFPRLCANTRFPSPWPTQSCCKTCFILAASPQSARAF